MADHYAQVSTEFVRSGPAGPEDVSLVLEQAPFPTDSGDILTMPEIAAKHGLSLIPAVSWDYVSSDIDEIYRLYYAQCGANTDGTVTATVNVFTVPSTLDYKLVTSSGTFRDNPTKTYITKESSVDFDLLTYVNLGFTVDEVVSMAWDGDVHNVNGSVVYPPLPTVSGSNLVMPYAICGVCRITYKVFGDVWTLDVPQRDDDNYNATVRAFYAGKVESLQINFPNLSGECSGSVSVEIDTGDEEQPPDTPGDDSSVAVQFVAYDFCTGEEISGANFKINGKTVSATGHTVKRGVTYGLTTTASGYKSSDQDDLDNDSFSV